MNEQNLHERVEPDDPRRCQHVIPNRGQCILVQVEGSKFCINHGGSIALKQAKTATLRNYRLNKFHQEIREKSDSSEIKSLRDEIGILRHILQEKINQCNDTHDLLLQSGPISDLVMKIDKVVVSCNRLETQLGGMLDTTQAFQLAAEFIEIISKYVDDEEALSAISNEFSQTISRPTTR